MNKIPSSHRITPVFPSALAVFSVLTVFIVAFFAVLLSATAFASEDRDAKSRRLRDRIVAIIATLPSPEEKAGANADLAKLLISAGDLEGAKGCIARMETLEESLRKGQATVQFASTLAELFLRLGHTESAGQVIHRVALPRQRAEVLLNVAGMVLVAGRQTGEAAKVWKPDAAATEMAQNWLREARSLVAELDAPDLAVVAPALLARELAIRGGAEHLAEARQLIAEAAEKARKMEAVEASEYLALIIKYLVDAKLDSDAQALAETGADEELKERLRGLFAISSLQAGRIDGAKAVLPKLQDPKIHDTVLAGLLRTIAGAPGEKGPTGDELAVLVRQARTEGFLQEVYKMVLAELLRTKRYETAQAWRDLADDKESDLLVRTLRMKAFFEEGRIPEAGALAEALDDKALVEPLKRNIRKEVGFALLRAKKNQEAGAMLAPLHDAERIERLGTELASFDTSAAPEEQVRRLAPIYRGYLDCGDFEHAKAVWNRMRQNAAKIANPALRFQFLGVVLQDVTVLGDVEGVNDVIDSIVSTLGALPQPPTPEKVKFLFQLIDRYRVHGNETTLNFLLERTETLIDTLDDPVQKCGALIVLYRMRFGVSGEENPDETPDGP